jgi:hypothetical protein
VDLLLAPAPLSDDDRVVSPTRGLLLTLAAPKQTKVSLPAACTFAAMRCVQLKILIKVVVVVPTVHGMRERASGFQKLMPHLCCVLLPVPRFATLSNFVRVLTDARLFARRVNEVAVEVVAAAVAAVVVEVVVVVGGARDDGVMVLVTYQQHKVR